MFLCFVILQIVLILSTECLSINLNIENKTTNIKITIPISSKGTIKVDEISIDNYCGENEKNIDIVPIVYESEIEVEMLPEAIDTNDRNDTVIMPYDTEEALFEGPVRASGSVNILGNFGPTMSGTPFIYPTIRPVPLYPVYPNPLSYSASSDESEQPDDPSANNTELLPYPFYRPGPVYPIFPSVMNNIAYCEEPDQQIDSVMTEPYQMYRPLPIYPFRLPTTNDLNKTTDLPARSKEPIMTLNDDTRQLLCNLMLLNVAHQSNIPCKVVPIPPANRTPEDENEKHTGIVKENQNKEVPSIVPVSGKVTIVGTNL